MSKLGRVSGRRRQPPYRGQNARDRRSLSSAYGSQYSAGYSRASVRMRRSCNVILRLDRTSNGTSEAGERFADGLYLIKKARLLEVSILIGDGAPRFPETFARVTAGPWIAA